MRSAAGCQGGHVHARSMLQNKGVLTEATQTNSSFWRLRDRLAEPCTPTITFIVQCIISRASCAQVMPCSLRVQGTFKTQNKTMNMMYHPCDPVWMLWSTPRRGEHHSPSSFFRASKPLMHLHFFPFPRGKHLKLLETSSLHLARIP